MAASKKQTGERKRRGRKPRDPDTEVRNRRVPVMVTGPELAKLERLADDAGVPVATIAYQLLSTALARRK